MRAVEIFGNNGCHDINVLYECMETFDHDCILNLFSGVYVLLL